MAREYEKTDAIGELEDRRYNVLTVGGAICLAALLISLSSFGERLSPGGFGFFVGFIPVVALFIMAVVLARHHYVEKQRAAESKRRDGKPVVGMPPRRDSYAKALEEARKNGKVMIDKYLVGYELDTGEPLWVSDDDMCTHAAVFAKTGVGKTLWLESVMFQQMARGRASGFTFIDAKRDTGTLADIILMALITGRIEDLLVVDPFDPVCAYNFVFTTQRPDVKARKILRCGLPPTPDQSTTKHYDRLAADAVYRLVRAMESLGLAWSVRDIAVALSAFTVAYPRMRNLLHERGARQAMVELGHLATSYRNDKGKLDTVRLTDNLRGIASELHSISNAEAGEMFCAPRTDLSLTDAIRRGKLIYYMLPRLEEAESAARMVKVFREDLEVSIGEVTSNRHYHLEDPHLVIIDEGASTLGPTWANLFELARKGRFALLFGAQSVGGLTDTAHGLSEQFYERVIANVNLKVIMRVGDNRTAMDMSEWIGKINTQKTSIGVGVMQGKASRELTKNVEVNKRASDGMRDAVTVADDEEDLVSPEELKHEMSAEKGLAWFDLGDGRFRKGRTTWFDSEIPRSWEGREFLSKFESLEADEVGIAEWVDEHILTVERSETERIVQQQESKAIQQQIQAQQQQQQGANGAANGKNGNAAPAAPEQKAEEQEKPEESGPFRFNLLRQMRGKPRARTFVGEKPEIKQQSENAQHNDDKSAVNSAPVAPEPAAPPQAPPEPPKPAAVVPEPRKSVAGAMPAAPARRASAPQAEKQQQPSGKKKKGKGKKSAPAPAQKDVPPKKGGLRLGGKSAKVVNASN